MLKLLEKIFGDKFWKNVMVETTFWAFNSPAIRVRNQAGEAKTEKNFARTRNDLFKKAFNLEVIA